VIIEGELSPDAPEFLADGPGLFDLSSRPTTTAKVKWSVPVWVQGDQGPDQTTSDISAIIQEIIDLPGWASGNSLVLIIRDDPDNPSAGMREAEDANPPDGNESALLHIEFESAPAPPEPEPTPPEPEPTPPEPEPTPPEPEPTPPEPEPEPPTPGLVERRIAASSDDAEERDLDDGYEVELDSSDLELAWEDWFQGDKQVVGLRFTDITIAKGTKIKKAWVQFDVDETKGGRHQVFLTVEGELSADAVTFSKAARDITGRPRTKADVSWSVPAWTVKHEQGPAQTTPDISDIIEEIVKQDGWVSGNSLVLIFSSHSSIVSTGIRCAESFDGTPEAAPLLHIEIKQ